MLINQIHFQSKIISSLNLIMFLLLWYVFILFNSLSLLFDCFPCVQLNSEVPLQDTKGYNDMTMLQSSQYFFFLFLSYFIWKSFLVMEGQAQTGGVGHGTKKRKSNWNADLTAILQFITFTSCNYGRSVSLTLFVLLSVSYCLFVSENWVKSDQCGRPVSTRLQSHSHFVFI